MGIIRNVKDWFNERGDDLFRVDKKVEELIALGLLPEEAYNTLERLETANKEALNDYKNAGIDLSEASDKRRDCYEKLRDKEEEFEQFKKEHFGLAGKFLYNLTPLRFFSTGREYQRLKREIKNLKNEHKFWTRFYDESTHVFEQTAEYRKEVKRTLAEYKRIIVDKAKTYKRELNLVKEYNKLRMYDEDKIKNIYDEEFASKLNSAIDKIKNKWFNSEIEDIDFDVTAVTRAITKIRKNQPLNEDDREAMSAIGNIRVNPQENSRHNSQRNEPETAESELDESEIENPEGAELESGELEIVELDPEEQEIDVDELNENKPLNKKDEFRNEYSAKIFAESSLDRRIVEKIARGPEKLCEKFGGDKGADEGVRRFEDAINSIKNGQNPLKTLVSKYGHSNYDLYNEIVESAKEYVAREKENQSITGPEREDSQLTQ